MTCTSQLRARVLALRASRVLLAILFVSGGLSNLLAYSSFARGLADLGIPMSHVLAAPAIATDLVGGVLLVLGFRLRLLAPYMALYTILTGFVAHPFWAFNDPNMQAAMAIQFWKNVAIAGGFLALFAASTTPAHEESDWRTEAVRR
ncbi:DoxX family protein [Paraburkholderia hospita]|uniref:DoxX family protein n=1 Tax=Paraburkholderia hospita TaxID=169430 RepID=UPI000DEF393E|nr:DoxX family protein [Paraburkholderia hospita]AXF05628.1 quinol oxidase [Paraburkholderia hospita]